MTGRVVSQTDHPRITIVGQFEHGAACTLILELLKGTWRLYRLGVTERPILIAKADLRRAAQEILGGAA